LLWPHLEELAILTTRVDFENPGDPKKQQVLPIFQRIW